MDKVEEIMAQMETLNNQQEEEEEEATGVPGMVQASSDQKDSPSNLTDTSSKDTPPEQFLHNNNHPLEG
eukprot:CAMPEP_0178807238 /NCGR_PEP_ID=MMETSP0745-20121128/16814_1 /TAXON_ID=913974 /ORGANISM="Nitzschia punctata, Strain CCMP561" /LENGTH=68 /DNA_ID=CAMNT_0020467207 /DNA_START=50 /DNA_END=256 /DNA_ORIENTATION=+